MQGRGIGVGETDIRLRSEQERGCQRWERWERDGMGNWRVGRTDFPVGKSGCDGGGRIKMGGQTSWG
jgi:hypothetical protein